MGTFSASDDPYATLTVDQLMELRALERELRGFSGEDAHRRRPSPYAAALANRAATLVFAVEGAHVGGFAASTEKVANASFESWSESGQLDWWGGSFNSQLNPDGPETGVTAWHATKLSPPPGGWWPGPARTGDNSIGLRPAYRDAVPTWRGFAHESGYHAFTMRENMQYNFSFWAYVPAGFLGSGTFDVTFMAATSAGLTTPDLGSDGDGVKWSGRNPSFAPSVVFTAVTTNAWANYTCSFATSDSTFPHGGVPLYGSFALHSPYRYPFGYVMGVNPADIGVRKIYIDDFSLSEQPAA